MARFVTSIFLALILIDVAAVTMPVETAEDHQPPTGIRRMIETFENKDIGAYQCALEGRERSGATPKRKQVCRALR